MDRFGSSYKLKLIIPSNYPMSPPMCYFDQNLPQEVVRRLDYIGQQNMLTIPYLQTWNPHQSNLTMLVNQLLPVVMNNPPVLQSQNPSYQQMPQQHQQYSQQAYGQTVMNYQPQAQQQQ